MTVNVTLVDAYDSFVYILAGYFKALGCKVRVVRKDAPDILDIIRPERSQILVLGPGPGHPGESGYLRLLESNAGRVPTLGVCLGHQAIGMYYGAKPDYAKRLMHGKTSLIQHDGEGVFCGFGSEALSVMRYHSIVLSDEDFPRCLKVTARSGVDGYVMGVRHQNLPIEGIQFHPESIGTSRGVDMLKNFISKNT